MILIKTVDKVQLNLSSSEAKAIPKKDTSHFGIWRMVFPPFFIFSLWKEKFMQNAIIPQHKPIS